MTIALYWLFRNSGVNPQKAQTTFDNININHEISDPLIDNLKNPPGIPEEPLYFI
jgi:hypothetical protein